jgi:hypothetical protein
MLQNAVLTLIAVPIFIFNGYLLGYKKGYGEGKRAGYFRAHQEVNR